MKLGNIHHLAIICSNYETSKNFYTEILGLEIVRETYRKERNSYKLDLKAGDAQIELISVPTPPKRLNYPEACGLRHFDFSVEDIDETVKYLKTKKIKVEKVRIDELTGSRYTFITDPDDLPIEIYEIKK